MPAKTVTTLGPLVGDFTEEFVRHTRGGRAGQLVERRPFQRAILDGLFELNPAGQWKHRQAMVILPRKSGKSLLLSGVATWALFASNEPGAEIFTVAASKDQARIVFQNIKDTVEADPDLSDVAEVYKDAIAVPSTGAVCRVLSSDGSLAHGLSPVVSIVDETWCHPTAELYEALLSGSGARRQSLLVHITTAGVGERTPLANLVEYDRRVQAGEVDDETWWSWWKQPRWREHRHLPIWEMVVRRRSTDMTLSCGACLIQEGFSAGLSPTGSMFGLNFSGYYTGY